MVTLVSHFPHGLVKGIKFNTSLRSLFATYSIVYKVQYENTEKALRQNERTEQDVAVHRSGRSDNVDRRESE